MWIILSFFEVSFEVQHCGSPFDWTRLYETLFCFGQRCQIPQHLFTDIHLHFMIPLVPNFIRGTAYNKYMDVSVLLYFVCIPAPVRKAANKVDVGEGMLRAAIIERYIYIYIFILCLSINISVCLRTVHILGVCNATAGSGESYSRLEVLLCRP